MRCTILIAALLLILHGQWIEDHSNAASRWTDDLTELALMTQAIVEVQVIHTETVHSPNSPLLMTRVEFEITATFKGKLDSARLTVEYPGGEDGEQRTVASGQPELFAGHRYVLLLARFKQSSNWSIVGGDAGQIELVNGNEGTVALRHGGSTFEYYIEDSTSLTGTRRVNCSEMSEAVFKDLIKTIVATGRPVIAAAQTQPAAMPIQANHRGTVEPEHAALPVLARLLLTLALISFIWFVGSRCVGK